MMSRLTLEELRQLPQEALIETILQLSFKRPALVMHVHFEPSWMDLFIKYLDQGKLPSEKSEAKKISDKAGNYLYEDKILSKGESLCPGSDT